MTSLNWHQVNSWRLAQHGLSSRLSRRNLLKAVTATCGLQAQVMSAAELAIGARVDGIRPQHVQSALWQDRTLVKTWAMRATLHLIAASDLPLFVAARSVHQSRNWQRYFAFFGITPTQSEALIRAVPQILGDEPMTRGQLATALGRHLRAPELGRRLLASSWGSLWKPSAWRGDLCFGPNDGRHQTFLRPSAWIGRWKSIEPYAALQEVARRYLQAYGPATPQNFAEWWGSRLTPARKLFQSIADELEPVEVEGWRAFALRPTLRPMQHSVRSGSVDLLPLFDAYVLGVPRDVGPLVSPASKRQIYRPQGWISAVVLVDGCIKGIWEYTLRPSQVNVTVSMFSRPRSRILRAIEIEAERLGAFWNAKVELKFVTTPVTVCNR